MTPGKHALPYVRPDRKALRKKPSLRLSAFPLLKRQLFSSSLSRQPAAAAAARPRGGTEGGAGGIIPPAAFSAFSAFPAFPVFSAFPVFPGFGAAPRGFLPVPSSFPGAGPRPALSGSLPLSRGLPPPPFRFRYENARPRNVLRSGVGFGFQSRPCQARLVFRRPGSGYSPSFHSLWTRATTSSTADCCSGGQTTMRGLPASTFLVWSKYTS